MHTSHLAWHQNIRQKNSKVPRDYVDCSKVKVASRGVVRGGQGSSLPDPVSRQIEISRFQYNLLNVTNM